MIPSVIIRQAYVRIGAFSGTAAEISTAYTGSLASLNTESFPLQSMWDMLTLVEGEMATAVGTNENSTLRDLIGSTLTVTAGGLVPATDIVGVWGQVRDTATGTELTPALHEDEIRALNGTPTVFKSSYFSYAYKPPRIYPTVDEVEIDVTVFDQAARQTVIEANEALLFPTCEGAYFSGLMSNLKNEDNSYTELSNQFAPTYQAWLESLRTSPRGLVTEAAA